MLAPRKVSSSTPHSLKIEKVRGWPFPNVYFSIFLAVLVHFTSLLSHSLFCHRCSHNALTWGLRNGPSWVPNTPEIHDRLPDNHPSSERKWRLIAGLAVIDDSLGAFLLWLTKQKKRKKKIDDVMRSWWPPTFTTCKCAWTLAHH